MVKQLKKKKTTLNNKYKEQFQIHTELNNEVRTSLRSEQEEQKQCHPQVP